MVNRTQLPCHRSGFTLIELSIVLVIIGLIVGSVLVGRDLVETSRIRAQISQIEQLNTATNTFLTKYNCLPGDCANYARFGFDAPIFGVVTKSGNGMIDGSWPNSMEGWTYYRHLFQAGLSSFSPAYSAIWGARDPQNANDSPFIYATTTLGSGVIFVYGGSVPTTNLTYSKNFIEISGLGSRNLATPQQAFVIDNKIDDGLPLTGVVVATGGIPNFNAIIWGPKPVVTQGVSGANQPYCVSTSVTPNFYNVQNSALLCNIRFDAAF